MLVIRMGTENTQINSDALLCSTLVKGCSKERQQSLMVTEPVWDIGTEFNLQFCQLSFVPPFTYL